jgi:hypothetical protein
VEICVAQTWAWTALGKLNSVLIMPDPRARSVPNVEWWTVFNQMIVDISSEPLE